MKLLARLAVPLVLLAVLVVLFSGPLLDGRVLAVADGLAQDFPLRLLVAHAWQSGVMPFWDPYVFGGLPLLAAIHVGVFFPGNLPFLFLPPTAAMNVTVLLALWLGGCGLYALARAEGLPRPAGLVGGLVFMLGGFMVAHIDNLQMLQAAALMPWLLAAIARHQAAKDGRYAIATAVLLALQVLAGHPQMVVFTSLVCGAYTLYLLAGTPAERRLDFVMPLVAAVLLGVGLAGLQLLPTLDFIPVTQRNDIDFLLLTFRSLPLRQLASFWFPYLFGGYGTPLSTMPYWGAPHQTELTGYGGLIGLVLAALALAAWRTERRVRFWLGVTVVGVLLAMGDGTPLYRLWALLPVLKSLPAPGRHLLEVDVALAMLAAHGARHWQTTSRPRTVLGAWLVAGLPLWAIALKLYTDGPSMERRLQVYMPPGLSLAGVFSLERPAIWVPLAVWLVCGALVFARQLRRREGLPYALMALVVLDMGLFALNQDWVVRSPRLPEPMVAPAPGLSAGEARALPVSSALVYPYDDFALVRSMRYPNWGGLVDVRSASGYDAFIPTRYAHLMGDMASSGQMSNSEIWAKANHALDLFGVRTVILDPILAADPAMGAQLAARGLVPTSGDPGTRRFLNPRALPRAWRVTKVASEPAEQVDTHVLRDAHFDPLAVAYLDTPDTLDIPLAGGKATAHAQDLDTIAVESSGAGPGLVAVSESFDPGWRAFLDGAGGKELAVHRLDGALLGVEVPAGDCHLSLRYEPRTWREGLGVTLLSALLLAAWALWERRRATT